MFINENNSILHIYAQSDLSHVQKTAIQQTKCMKNDQSNPVSRFTHPISLHTSAKNIATTRITNPPRLNPSPHPLQRPLNPHPQSLQCLLILHSMAFFQKTSQVRQPLLDYQRTLQNSHGKSLLRLRPRVVWGRVVVEHFRVKVRWIGKVGASVMPGWDGRGSKSERVA